MTDKWEDIKRQLFAKKLEAALSDWKEKNKDKGGKADLQKSFAMMIGVSENMIPRYKSGESYPRKKTIQMMCNVLGVPSDYFNPKTPEELYEYSPDYITDLGKKHRQFSAEIGLSLDFLKGLHNIVDFDSLFPMYAPIIDDRSDIRTKYKRQSDFANSAPIDDDLDFMQIHKDDKTLTLHRCDLAYLREVQEQIIEYVEFLFYKRREEMKKEVEEVNSRTHFKTPGGDEGFRPIHEDELCEIDRFRKIAYEEA